MERYGRMAGVFKNDQSAIIDMEKTKVRQSNIELLRNISMFMILVIHANFVSLPKIGYEELVSNTTSSVFRFLIESLGVVAVNVFVFISGWFGINTRKKSILAFIYLILFYLGGGGILFILLGQASFSLHGLLGVFQLTPNDWFIKSYFVLMIIAPILNAYTKNVNEITQRYVMISFFLFEAIYGWAAGGRRFFVDGYGPLHFIGLYITAQYIHNQIQGGTTPKYIRKLFQLPKWADMTFFLVLACINTLLVVTGSMYLGSTEGIRGLVFAYSNPLVILGALFLLLFFSKLKMPYVKTINWLGASSFAVYLFHSEPTIRSHFFTPQVQYLYGANNGLACIILIFLFLLIIYLVSVLIDQLRILSWDKIWALTNKQKNTISKDFL